MENHFFCDLVIYDLFPGRLALADLESSYASQSIFYDFVGCSSDHFSAAVLSAVHKEATEWLR